MPSLKTCPWSGKVMLILGNNCNVIANCHSVLGQKRGSILSKNSLELKIK